MVFTRGQTLGPRKQDIKLRKTDYAENCLEPKWKSIETKNKINGTYMALGIKFMSRCTFMWNTYP